MTRREMLRHAGRYLVGMALLGLARFLELLPSRKWSE